MPASTDARRQDTGVEQPVPDASVVICCYTEARWNDLLAAIDSVQRQRTVPSELVVVVDDNQSLFRRLRSEMPSALVVENCHGRGLSGARNTGIALTSGAVVAFLDDDAIAEPDWLARLTEGYVDPRVLGVGGRIEPLWQTARPDWFPAEFNWVVGCSYRGLPTTTAPVRNLIGANMSFRRTVFEEAGGFRSELGYDGARLLGNEETELSIRAQQRWPDGILLHEPRALVRHRVPASRAQWSYFRSRCYAEGLAKARTSRLVGMGDGLTAEWQHTLRTLPAGVLRSLGDVVGQGDLSGLGRAATIVAGLAVTTAGYLAGSLDAAWAGQRRSRDRCDTTSMAPPTVAGPAMPASPEPASPAVAV